MLNYKLNNWATFKSYEEDERYKMLVHALVVRFLKEQKDLLSQKAQKAFNDCYLYFQQRLSQDDFRNLKLGSYRDEDKVSEAIVLHFSSMLNGNYEAVFIVDLIINMRWMIDKEAEEFRKVDIVEYKSRMWRKYTEELINALNNYDRLMSIFVSLNSNLTEEYIQ